MLPSACSAVTIADEPLADAASSSSADDVIAIPTDGSQATEEPAHDTSRNDQEPV